MTTPWETNTRFNQVLLKIDVRRLRKNNRENNLKFFGGEGVISIYYF